MSNHTIEMLFVGVLAPITIPIAICVVIANTGLSDVFDTKKREELSVVSKMFSALEGAAKFGTVGLITTCLFSPPVMASCAAFLGVAAGAATALTIGGIGLAAIALSSYAAYATSVKGGVIERG